MIGPVGWRVLAFGAFMYSVVSAANPGTHGAALLVLLTIVATGLGMATAMFSAVLARNNTVMIAGLAVTSLSGGILLSQHSIGVLVGFVAALSAATRLDATLASVIAALGIAAASVAIAFTDHGFAVLAALVAAAAGGLLTGVLRRQRDTRVAHAAALALEQQRAELEHARAEVLAERHRLAREVHDVLAHTLSALAVQMEAVNSLVEDDADTTRVRAAVQRARNLAVDGLDEARRAVGVLRDEPVAVMEQLQVIAADDGARFVVCGDPRPLPAAHGHALVRVAQEAMTNVRKHAPMAVVGLTLDFGDGETALTVDNGAGRGGSPLAETGGGYGLTAMRERVELVGGRLTAGPHDRGWRVQAVVPA